MGEPVFIGQPGNIGQDLHRQHAGEAAQAACLPRLFSFRYFFQMVLGEDECHALAEHLLEEAAPPRNAPARSLDD